jgi:hypothetical protein
MPKRNSFRQPAIYDDRGRRLRRLSITQAMHPKAREDFADLCADRGVSRSWAGAYLIECFLYGEGNTYAEDPGVDVRRRRKG